MILALKTNEPEAHVVLLGSDNEVIAERQWTAHRQLSVQLLHVIDELLQESKIGLKDVEKVAVFEGPGSYTGLRIGISVANTFAYSLGVPVVGVTGGSWIDSAVQTEPDQQYVAPVYGGEAHITQPRK